MDAAVDTPRGQLKQRRTEHDSKLGIEPSPTCDSGYQPIVKNPYLLGATVISGIYIFFIIFGYVQEHIFHVGDKLTGDNFSHTLFLVFALCCANTVCSGSILLVKHSGNLMHLKQQVDGYALQQLALTSLTYVGAMLSTNYALTHVNYPTQILVKSAKMVPIVIGGFLIFGKTYPWYDYASVVVVTVSLFLFNFTGSKTHKETHQTVIGLFLLAVSLVCDGMTGPRQDKLLSRYKNISPVSMMFLTNLFAVGSSGLATMVLEGKTPIQFCLRYPETIKYLVLLSFCASMGQLFIFLSLSSFGSLYTSLITTLRKATSTVISVYFFGHRLTLLQWGCVAAIFCSLALQSYCSKSMKTKRQVADVVKKLH